jgi:crotonobetainyl-CoA:carnitine CoA-transferase CaiB-like acyl-CoA transferase
MTTTFGPQLIGQTEKTLQALLRRALADTGLSERQWVALRLADQPDGTDLRHRVADQAKFDDADQLVTALEQRGLIADDASTVKGHAMVDGVLARSAALSGPIWDDIDDADAAARALNVVLRRARAAVGEGA